MHGATDYYTGNDEDEDAELQAALALSLQQQQQQQQEVDIHGFSAMASSSSTTTGRVAPPNAAPLSEIPTSITTTFAASTDDAHPPPLPLQNVITNGATPAAATLPLPDSTPSSPIVVNATAEPFDGIVAFHSIMWDDAVTTVADKERWLSQGIDVRDDGAGTSVATTSAMAIDAPATTAASALLGGPLFWGLVQEHGGPCGVLAAVQAELLRVVFFGEANAPSLNVDDVENSDLAARLARVRPHVVRTALARSIALILARATLTPSVAPTSTSTSTSPLPNDATLPPPPPPPTNASDNHVQQQPVSVRIVLPNVTSIATSDAEQPLQWHDLAPWLGGDDSAVVVSSSLTVYNISIPNEESLEGVTESSNPALDTAAEATATTNTMPKRQKTLVDGTSYVDSAMSSSLAARIQRTARVVEAFLLDETRGGTVPAPAAAAAAASADAVAAASATTESATAPLDCFRRQGGVLLLVMSLTATRPFIQQEFDDPVGSRLVAQFGHTGQELINLLLTGQAVSNVFDNTLSPSGDMVCRGIQSRPVIGYLSQLEAMRYCEVGGYYKSPLFPIWVVGSTSHFTVLFGDPASLKESKSDLLLDECRRAFKAVEGGEENGFIKTDQLGSVLKSLNIRLGDNSSATASSSGTNADDADETARQQTLAASLEVGGAGIILWDDFWKAVSRLLTGASLETVLQGDSGDSAATPMIVDGVTEAIMPPPPLLTNFAANPGMHVKPTAKPPAVAAIGPNFVESDEEMARRLGAEWGTDGSTGLSALSNAASLASSMEIEQTATTPGVMSDEEMARKLQEQFDAEGGVGGTGVGSVGSLDGLHGSSIPGLSDTDDNSSTAVRATPTQVIFNVDHLDDANTKPAAQGSMNAPAFEQHDRTFSMYHYNGLRGGVLTPFRVTRLTAEEAVGTSIALNRQAGGSTTHGGSQDLEDVVRTKWPSCVINWFGQLPPYID